MNFKILFFDLDNTLIDRNRAFSLWLQNFHFKLKRTYLDEAQLTELLEVDNYGMGDRRDFWQKYIDDYGLTLSVYDLQARLNSDLAAFVKKDKDVTAMLERLSDFYDLRLISNGSSVNQRAKLEASGLESFFSRVYISEEMGCRKPLLFEIIAKGISCLPEECLMVGDNYEADILGAQKVGFKTCFIGDEEADFNVTSVTELENVLCLLN